MFGFAAETPQEDVRPFELERFVDPQARDGFLERLQRDGAVHRLPAAAAARRPDADLGGGHRARRAGCATALRVEALMRDVSERKRLEDQARDLYHQLLQAEKLAALGQTISGVAHELNNPLATILTWAERLSQRPRRRSDAPRPRDDPQRVGARRQDRPQPADLRAQAAHDARDGRPQSGRARDAGAALVRAARQQHHHPRGARRRACRRSFADPHQIQQVLLNLIINAEQAMIGAQRPRHADRAHLARRRSRRGRPRGQRRRAGRAGGGAAADLRSVLHDQGGRQGHRPRPDRRLRDRAGARRAHHA